MREAVPPERIAKTIAEGMGATETKFFSHEGVVQDSREVVDYSERRAYAQLAAELGGYHMPEKNEGKQGGGVILILPDGSTVIGASSAENSATLLLPDKRGHGGHGDA